MSFLTLDLNLLRVFDSVMTEQNLTRAANRLAMTQPAVSNALKRLRDALGDELLMRTAHGVKPTPRAEELWPSVRRALSELEAAVAPTEFDISKVQATFRMAMADATAVLWLPSLVRSIESAAPGVNVRMVPLTTREPRPMLLRGDIDLAIGFFPGVVAQLSGGPYTPIRHERLYSGQYVCVMRKNHPLANEDLTIDTYCAANHLLVSFSGRAHQSRTAHPVDGQSVLHRRSRGRQFRSHYGLAAPPDRLHRHERFADFQDAAVQAAGRARRHAVA